MRPILFCALVAAATIASAAAPANAQTMNAETFYQRAKKLEAKGMAAMFAADLKPIMSEMQAAGKIVQARRLAAEAKKEKLYCPPPRAHLGAKEMLKLFGNIPQAERQRMTTTDAYQRILVAKFPC